MDDILDLGRFPLDRPGTAEWQSLVDACRTALATDGMYTLEGLLFPQSAQAEVSRLEDKFASEAFRHEREHNIYFLKSLEDVPPDHPALRRFRTSNQTLCADQVTGGALERLYEWPAFAQFLAATMDRAVLHPMEDPLARINVMSYNAGQTLNWHFDRSEFTTTLLLQAPDEGGAFEYRTHLRSETDPNYDGVARLLEGRDTAVKTLHLTPGSLNVFKGKNTAHRVTQVGGARARIIAVFSYYDRPGVTFSAEERLGFYGRAG